MKLKLQELIFSKTGLLNHNTTQGGTGNIPLAVVGNDAGFSGSFVFHDYVAAGAPGNYKAGLLEFLNYYLGFAGSELGHVLFSHGRGELQPDEGTLAGVLFRELLSFFHQVCQVEFHRFGDISFCLPEISPIIGNVVEDRNLGAYLTCFFVKGIYHLVFGNHEIVPPNSLFVIILTLTGQNFKQKLPQGMR